MTVTTVQLCRCGHAEQRHTDEEGCDRSECGCVRFRAGRLETVLPPAPSAPVVARPPAAPARPAARPPAVVPPASAPTIEQIIALGERADSQRIRSMAERARKTIDTLRTAITQDRAAAEAKRRAAAEKEAADRRRAAERDAARQRVAELERQLAAERAKLRGDRTPPSSSKAHRQTGPGTHACTRDGCDRTFVTGQARAMHERRTHDGFDPRAAKASA